jgi:hypothetical protein
VLRQALSLQEANVGPNHPDVANILNNLAIVCELNGKLTDAEACYRRAYAIATSSLAASDPFVTTSRENLEQFCTARGIPVKEAPPVASSPAPTASSAPAPTCVISAATDRFRRPAAATTRRHRRQRHRSPAAPKAVHRRRRASPASRNSATVAR